MQHYYDDLVNELCVACSYKCSSCSNGTSCNSCNSTKFRTMNLTSNICDCMVGWYDAGSSETCLLCNPSCLACTNGTNCSTCSAANFRIINATITPYCACMWKYYASSSSVCAACHYSCQSCTNGTITGCLTCLATAPRHLLTSGRCNCTGASYDDGANWLCSPCDFKCTTCYGSSDG